MRERVAIAYHRQGFPAPVVGYKYDGTGGVVHVFFKAVRVFKNKLQQPPLSPAPLKYASGMVLLLAV